MSHLDFIRNKIYTRDHLHKKLALHRFMKRKIVFTNGCFDLLHRGHIEYLSQAADLGDFFVVGVNSDASVGMLHKGDNRPLQDELSRSMIVASLFFVSAVIVFEEETPLELIRYLQPDVLVKGGDYDAEEKDPKSKKYIVGSDIVRKNGGEIKTIPLVPGLSSTAIEKKILSGK